jgi:hypothetical protein
VIQIAKGETVVIRFEVGVDLAGLNRVAEVATATCEVCGKVFKKQGIAPHMKTHKKK